MTLVRKALVTLDIREEIVFARGLFVPDRSSEAVVYDAGDPATRAYAALRALLSLRVLPRFLCPVREDMIAAVITPD